LHNQEVQKLKGYLPISRLHYVTALHEIRRFCCYRNDLSGGYFNRMGETETDRTKSTLRSGTWPSFVHLTAASSLVDLGELMRGGLTGSLILKDHDDLDPNGPDSVLEESYLTDIEKAFSQWVESPDDRVNQDAVRKAVTVDQVWASYLGVWHPDRVGDKRNGQRVRLEFEPSRKDALFLGFAVSVLGADQTRKGGLPIAAANEYEIVLTHIGRMLRNILVLRKLKQRAPAIKNLDLGVDTGQIRIVEKLASLALSVLERLETLRRADGSADKFGYRIGYDVPVSLATSVLNLTWTLAALRDSLSASQKGPMSVALKQFDKCLEDWFGKPEHEDFYDMRWLKMGEHRTIQLCRSRLLRMADRHHFPVLSSLEIKKSLIDMVLLGMRADDGALSELSTETELPADLKARRKHVALSPIETLDSRWTEALGWLDELVHKEQLVDAQMHFTPTKLAETMALFAVMMPGDLLKKKKKPRKTLKADAVDLIDRAEQSFSMGRQYYSNINKLYYNFDDFNDRSRHAEHSASMMMADVLAYLRVAVKSTPE